MHNLFANFTKKKGSKGKARNKPCPAPARPPTEIELLVSKLTADKAALAVQQRGIHKETEEASKELETRTEALEASKTELQKVQQELLDEAGEVQALLQQVAAKESALGALRRNEALAREALRAAEKQLGDVRAENNAEMAEIMVEARNFLKTLL